MPSIQDLLNNLGVDDLQEKTASADLYSQDIDLDLGSNEGTTKEASSNNGGNMNLHDLYEAHFGEDVIEKTASYDQDDEELAKEAAHNMGAMAGLSFQDALSSRMAKFAMDQEMESAATEMRDGSSAVAVPGARAASPQLPQNKPKSAKEGRPMDTTPSADIMNNGPLLDKAIQKAVILKALAENDTDRIEGISQVDTGLEMPNSQKDA